jgi:glycosyltransferase involved in cell wall biosynthesis
MGFSRITTPLEPRLEIVSDGPLRVGADLGCLVPGTSGGIVSVIEGVLTELARRPRDVELVVFATPVSKDVVGSIDPSKVVIIRAASFYETLNRHLAERRVDVLFRAYPTIERVDFPLERQIVLMPDLLHELAPEYFDATVRQQRRAAFAPPLSEAGAIATVSSYARAMIQRVPGRTADVFVMYPSVPVQFACSNSSDATDEERALVPDGEFFLYPANPWPSKNHARIVQAVQRYREETGRPTALVLTGKFDDWSGEQVAGGDGFVRHLGYVRAPLLRLLYERATALTFFSLHEGFGIPVLEAFDMGTPVLCSNVSSLPEVVGDAALTCDPTDVDAMAGVMAEVATNPGLRDLLVRRGRERLAVFTWARAADAFEEAIERVSVRVTGSGR